MNTIHSEDSGDGTDIFRFAAELFPICRSITGSGTRQTLQLVARKIPLVVTEVPTGTQVFDWEVPDEWNIENAWIKNAHGEKVVDFLQHNLHLMSYSEPVTTALNLKQLQARLHSLPENPDWIPYRTSYYERDWAFCLRHNDRTKLSPGNYDVEISSDLSPGSLTYAECILPGRSQSEVLLFTHICHPSLANDNTSGIAVLTQLAGWLASESRRFSYRLIFAPGTIGSLCWLANNEHRLDRIRHGLVTGLLGDGGPLTYKSSRRGNCEIDRVVPYALQDAGSDATLIPFEPYGYDERQFCSPGFNLPVGRLTRSPNGCFDEYHSSADNLDLISAKKLQESFDALKQIVRVLESNRRYQNTSPKGEPRLGKRGLYGSVGGQSPSASAEAMLWVLNQSDGATPLIDIARRSGIDFDVIKAATDQLEAAGLLKTREKQ